MGRRSVLLPHGPLVVGLRRHSGRSQISAIRRIRFDSDDTGGIRFDSDDTGGAQFDSDDTGRSQRIRSDSDDSDSDDTGGEQI